MTAAFGMHMYGAVRQMLLMTKIGSISQPFSLLFIQVDDDPMLVWKIDFDNDVECLYVEYVCHWQLKG